MKKSIIFFSFLCYVADAVGTRTVEMNRNDLDLTECNRSLSKQAKRCQQGTLTSGSWLDNPEINASLCVEKQITFNVKLCDCFCSSSCWCFLWLYFRTRREGHILVTGWISAALDLLGAVSDFAIGLKNGSRPSFCLCVNADFVLNDAK